MSTTLTLVRTPARGLVAPGLDPRPCVTNPPQWWDLGNDGNADAIWLCRNICPKAGTCEIGPGAIRRGQAWGDSTNCKQPRPLRICADCEHPVCRNGEMGRPRCKCPGKYRSTASLVAEWVERNGHNRAIKQVATEMGVSHQALKDALTRARAAGDPRVPAHLHRYMKQEAAA